MKRTMRNIRFRKNEGPSLPIHRNDIKFPENFTKLPNGEEFLYFDSGHVGNMILIFSTIKNLQLLMRSSHWYADGTFKSVPLLFHQLYTIHGLEEGNSIPLVYALLPGKSTKT